MKQTILLIFLLLLPIAFADYFPLCDDISQTWIGPCAYTSKYTLQSGGCSAPQIHYLIAYSQPHEVSDACYGTVYRDFYCTGYNIESYYTEKNTDSDGDTYNIECEADCNDSANWIYPGAPELNDNIDQNCRNDAPEFLATIGPFNLLSNASITIINLSSFVFDTDGDSFTFSIADENESQVNCAVVGEMFGFVPDIAFAGISHCTINATDIHNSSVSQTATFNVSLAPDTTAPVISNIQVSNITNESAIISWDTDELSNSTVNYNTEYEESNIFTLTHQITLTNLINNTLYQFTVTSCDASGNCTISASNNFTTMHNYNSFAPVITLNSPSDIYFSDISDPINILFNCSATDDINLASISLYITDNQNNNFALNQTSTISGTSNESAWTLSLNNGNYTWNCIAFDSDGLSDWDINRSITINYSAPVIPDNPPQVFLANPVNSSIDYDGTVFFGCDISDDYGLINVTLYTDVTGTWQAYASTDISGTLNLSDWNITGIADGDYLWNCLAYDNASNSAWAAANNTFTVNTSASIPTTGNVVINEFYAPTTSDWIEIYNNGTFAVNVTGWQINDSSTNSQIINGILLPGNFIQVNFSTWLNNGGDTIYLRDLTGVIDSYTYTSSFANISFGRYPDSTDNWANLTPTPGSANILYLPGNNAPTFTTPQVNTSIQNNTLFTFDIDATDSDGDVLIFSDDASQFDIDSATGLINFTPTAVEVITATIKVCDNTSAANNCTTQPFILNVTLVPSNDAPVFTSSAVNQSWHIKTLFSYDINATDSDLGDILTYSSDNILVTINASTGLVEFTPDTIEVIAANITVCDNSAFPNNCTTQPFTLNITNTQPTFTTSPVNSSILNNTLFTFDINATDADSDTLIYSSNDSLLNIDTNTGLISFTTPSHPQIINAIIAVCDSTGAANNCTTQDFILDVHGPLTDITNSWINGTYYNTPSSIENIDSLSTIRDSNITDDWEITDSDLQGVTLINGWLDYTNASNSLIINSWLIRCTVTNSLVKNYYATDCIINDSTVDPPTGMNNLTGSIITAGSNVTNSDVTYSNVSNSNITDSNIDSSVITNSEITNSVIDNATIEDILLDNSSVINSELTNTSIFDANVTDNVIYSGTITLPNGTNYTITTPVNLTEVINYAPTAVINPTTASGTDSLTVNFNGLSSIDPNIPGILNDNLTYSWDFTTDGVIDATGNSTSYTYGVGTFTATLTATDKFGATDTDTATITVSQSTPPGGSGGGGSSGGGITGLTYIIDFSNNSVTKTLKPGDRVKFLFEGMWHYITVQKIINSSVELKIQSGIVYKTVEESETVKADINADSRNDISIKAEDVSSTGATLNFAFVSETTVEESSETQEQQKETTSESSFSAGTSLTNLDGWVKLKKTQKEDTTTGIGKATWFSSIKSKLSALKYNKYMIAGAAVLLLVIIFAIYWLSGDDGLTDIPVQENKEAIEDKSAESKTEKKPRKRKSKK